MTNISDTLHLFWAQEEKLMYSYLALTSTSVEPEAVVANELVLSPNPCADQLMVNFNKGDQPSQLTIFDATGRLMLEQNLRDKAQINVGSLPPGVYCLSVAADGVQHTQTFVKH